ncbi:Isoquinoline 1-oxidoreductase subunit [uncultured Enterovirga sp.]|uniref:Isoquinoline 1-oxidoreductase subunit n=1 Tax=uncultured Enterovirga sp. TaxID=2026352 RepID=UPI0035CA7A53
MRNSIVLTVLAISGLSFLAAWPSGAQQAGRPDLRTPESFGSIGDPKARSVALFEEAGRVLTHPRCLNCHPVSDRPLQGETSRPHEPPIFAGETGLGSPSMPCTSCHGQSNFRLVGTRVGSMPGNPKWQLAPREMAWENQTLGAICRQLKDPARNGGKDFAALIEHSAHDELVGWGWNPGVGRASAPGTQELFGLLVKAWIETGAECPD